MDGQALPLSAAVAEEQSRFRAPTEPPPKRPPGQALPDLPVNKYKEELLKTINSQRVTVIVGGTGCGKSTQVPQLLLDEAAEMEKPLCVLVTQPRRMAAVALARRVAQERDLRLGKDVGYRIRGEVVPGDYVQFLTAGYLLSWFTAEPANFSEVTHLVLDEAHERSADMELLLLFVRLLMRIYPKPRVILMSATIEAESFSDYFAEFSEPAGSKLKPIYVGDRLFPVEVVHLEDLAQGKGPRGFRFTEEIETLARGAEVEVFAEVKEIKEDEVEEGGGTASSWVKPRVYKPVMNLATKLIPQVAEGGTTILIFTPGYADLVRMHSILYWDLPVLSSVNMGSAPPKPEEVDQADELAEITELEDLEESKMEGTLGGRFGLDMRDGSGKAEDEEVTRPDWSGGANVGLRYRLFALHSQIPAEDQELVMQTPPPGICHLVLATTIAESSLTLPEVRGIIDFGVHRTTVGDPNQGGLIQLTTRWCSMSSIRQREGRAGRTRPGWCVRLIPSQFERYLLEYDMPEILRTPLARLVLQAKGISDGLKKAVETDDEAMQRLQLSASTPGALLAQLPAPPAEEAVTLAIRELAELQVLTNESDSAEVTVLGRMVLWLPMDVRLCRLIWLGSIWGCAAEAVVLAAACSVATPFISPSRLAYGNQEEFVSALRNSVQSRRSFDGGHFSEPLMLLRLFCSWLRRLNIGNPKSSHNSKWFRATESICEAAAVDPQKMSIFVAFVADVAIRARDMCFDGRGDDACSVRSKLHDLIRIMRRPDLSPLQQRQRSEEEVPPKVGEVFTASAPKLYALLAAAFSDQLFVGRHRYMGSSLGPMLDAVEKLNAVGSEDAILMAIGSQDMHRGRLSTADGAKKVLPLLCGEEAKEVVVQSGFVAAKFKKEPPDQKEFGRRGSGKWDYDQMTFGLPPVRTPRLLDLALAPRIVYASSGGLRKFSAEGMELFRAQSPYELQFSLVSASYANTRVLGLFPEQNPLGFATHIVSPGVELGLDDFACVASDLTISEGGGGVRASGATMLCAEQILYALTTLNPESAKLQLGFQRGVGGDDLRAHAALGGIRLQGKVSGTIFIRSAPPGKFTVDKVNAVRKTLLNELLATRQRTSSGQDVLLWESSKSKAALEELISLVEEGRAERGFASEKLCVPNTWVQKHTTEKGHKNIQSLKKIQAGDQTEQIVAARTISNEGEIKVTHKFECPDCGERFNTWSKCCQHYEETGHMDVSTAEAIAVAKAYSRPVRYVCLECLTPFQSWSACKQHLDEEKHLSWADNDTQRLLCLPMPKLEANPQVREDA